MPRNLNNYIKSERKRLGLSQKELARLLGKRSHTYVSRFENGRRTPALSTAFALEVALGVPLRELFKGRFAKVEKAVRERQALLVFSLGGDRVRLRRSLVALEKNSSQCPESTKQEF